MLVKEPDEVYLSYKFKYKKCFPELLPTGGFFVPEVPSLALQWDKW
jgi:hypothetical protein